MEENQNQTQQQETVQQAAPATEQTTVQGQSKTAIGFVCAFFLGLWGLLIGLFCFKEGTYERKTFFKGFWWTFGAMAIATVVLTVLIVIIVIATGFLAGI